MKRILAALIIAAQILSSSGCVIIDEVSGIMAPAGRLENAAKTEAALTQRAAAPGFDYTLLIGVDGVKRSMYEPEEGCYLGASVWRDKRIGGDMMAFDAAAGKEHAISAISMNLGGEYPEQWILQCVASQKTPFLTVNPPDGSNPFDEELLLKTAAEIGKFNVPVFVDFYPYSGKMGYSAETYKKFFRRAWLVLKELAPNAAMVWSVNVWDADTYVDYFPGNSYVEWVGVNIIADITSGGGHADFITAFDSFCSYFQILKPIMVTSLAVSHFSTLDNTYYTERCADLLTEFYGHIEINWPRVKAIICHDYNAVGSATVRGKSLNNYLITEEERILSAYSAAISPDSFLSAISDYPGGNQQQMQLMKSSDKATRYNGEYYITAKSLEGCIPADSPLFSSRPDDILGERCYSAAALREYAGGDVYYNEASKVISLTFDEKQ